MPFSGYQAGFTGGVIGPSLSARVDLSKYASACKRLNNMLVFPQGGVSKRPGLRLAGEISGEAVLAPFVFNSSGQSYVLVFADYKMYVGYEGALLGTGDQAAVFAAPFNLAQARVMSHAQYADIMYLAHPDLPPYKLMRYGHSDWRFAMVNFQPPAAPAAPLGVTLVGEVSDNTGSKEYHWAYTTVDEAGNESLLGGEVSAASRYLIEGSYWKITVPYIAGAQEYRLYKMRGGAYGYIGSQLETDRGKGFIDENINPDLTKGPPRAVELFQSAGNYPSLTCFYQQRLCFAASRKQPQSVWMSRSNNFENFSNSVPVVDDGAIEITMAGSEVSMPVWLKVLRSLVLGSGSGVWEIAARDEIFTPSNLSCTIQSYRGCQAVGPVVVGNRLLYAMTGGRQIYELAYDFGSDSYADNDCSILAPHLFEGRQVVSMAYQADPWSIVWLVMSDGKMLSLTFIKEHEVFAWAGHETQGEIKSLCVLPERGREKLYLLVRRGDKFFLEVMADAFSGENVRDAFYVDCGMSLASTAPVSLISGLEHLEGRQVEILADGAAHPPRVVDNGSVSLQHPGRVIHVGLSYAGEMETLPLQVLESRGSSVGMKKRIHAVNVMFYRTVTCKVGRGDVPDKPLDESAWRTVEPYGAPVIPAAATKLIRLAGGWSEEATLRFVSDQPLPLTILSLAPEFDVASGG